MSSHQAAGPTDSAVADGVSRVPDAPAKAARPEPTWERKLLGVRLELWALLLILVAALAMRLYDLGSFPNTVLADETDNAQNGIYIVHGFGPTFFGFDWTGQPAFDVYLLAIFFRLFGVSVFVLRLPAALLSTLALLPFYFLLRRAFSIATSLAVTLLLSTVVWYLNFSRSGWNNVFVSLFLLGAMLALAAALDRVRGPARPGWRAWVLFALAGACCALALYGYPSGRAVILGVVACLPVAILFYRREWKRVLAGYGVLAVTALVLFAPQAMNIAADLQAYMGRSNVVSITNAPEFKADPGGFVWAQVSHNVLGLWEGRWNNTPQYSPVGEPLFDPVSLGLLLPGMLLSAVLPWMHKRPDNWLWWVMLLVAWVSTQVMTVGTPNGARGVGWMPLYLYFAAVTLDALERLVSYSSRRLRLPSAAKAVPVGLLLALVAWGAVANVYHYVDWQNRPATRTSRWIFLDIREFPSWAAAETERARNKQGGTNLGQWRDAHPEYTATNSP